LTVNSPPDHAATKLLAITVARALHAIVLLPALACAATAALVAGGTNLPAAGYPSYKCAAPVAKPDKPFRNDEYSVRSYNTDVERYNRQLTEYRDCMSTYVDNANNDIKRIQEAAKKALDDFRSLQQ
jgi:hypothetical protein